MTDFGTCPVCGELLSRDHRYDQLGTLRWVYLCNACEWNDEIDPDMHALKRYRQPDTNAHQDRRDMWRPGAP